VHCNADSALEGSADVVSIPGDAHRDKGVNTGGGEEGPGVLDMGFAAAEEQGETTDGNGLEDQHKDTALLHLVCSVPGSNGEEAGNNIWWNSHQLCSVVRVSKILDDCRKEQGDRVKWSVNSDRDEHVDVDLPVLKSVENIFKIKLIGKGMAISLQAALDFVTLLVCEELCARRKLITLFSNTRSDTYVRG
jgi:hypothetical protein